MNLNLSKNVDPRSYARLVDAWRDESLTVGNIAERFHTTPADLRELKRVLGPKTPGLPESPWWRQDRARNAKRKAAAR